LAAGEAGELKVLDFRRDDGCFLSLKKTDKGYAGELLTGAREVRAEVLLVATAENKLAGTAHFVEGGLAEAGWKLALRPDGSLEARCQWVDWDPAAKLDIDRGDTVRTFKPLTAVTIGGTGAAPEKVDAGQPIDEAALAG